MHTNVSITKSERDSAVLEGLVRGEGLLSFTMVVRRAVFGATIRHCLRGIGTVSL